MGKTKAYERLNLWLPVFLWGLVIFLFSSLSTTPVSQSQFLNFLFFKNLHFWEYAILLVLTFRAVKNSFKLPVWEVYLVSLLLVVVFSLTDEIHQTFVPGREGKLKDVLIDTFSAGFILVLIWKWLPKAPKKLKSLAKSWQIA